MHNLTPTHATPTNDRPRQDGWFQTFTGRQYWPFDPRVGDFCIADIAHALSLIPRFGGHSKVAYSVGQHSLYVSYGCSPANALCGLMHDATEAYLGDMVQPFKRGMYAYQHIEKLTWGKIAEQFGLPLDMPDEVKRVDAIALVTERRDLTTRTSFEWEPRYANLTPTHETLFPLAAEEIEFAFAERFKGLEALKKC
jgi:hypothetical protein